MDRLTDADIRKIAGEDPSTASLEILVETVSELTLKAVAEWLGERCDKPDHRREGSFRGTCVPCVSTLFVTLGEGKMPGETS